MKRNTSATVLCAIVLAGCASTNRYELSKDSTGRLVRLDTQTGELMLIEGDRLTPIMGTATVPTQTGSKIPQVTLPDAGNSWPELTVPALGNARAALTSAWHDGKLHYVLELYPLSKRLKLVHSEYYSRSTFSLILSDTAGKQTARTDVPTSRLTRVISTTRNAEELSAEGDIAISKEDYDRLADWQLLWNP